jgi:hypothetical protein
MDSAASPECYRTRVKIAAAVDADRSAYGLPQIFDPGGYNLGLEFEFVVGVRAGHDVGGAALRRQSQHFERLFESLRTIIHTRQDVAVDIDKIQINISSSCVA